MPPLFDDEFMGPIMGALSGTTNPDDMSDYRPSMDVWEDRAWLVPGARPRKERDPLRDLVFNFQDDGDPGHEIADERALQAGVDVRSTDADLMTIAKSQIGAPYIWADANPVGAAGGPGAGFDCSGFTQWVLSRYGIKTEHLSAGQQRQFKHVDREDLQPGDLVFYHYSDRNGPGDTADHVEMYIGDGKTIGSSGGGVMVREVNWDAFVGGGATGINAAGETVTPRRRRHPGNKPTPVAEDLTTVPMGLSGEPYSSIGLPTGTTGLPSAMADMILPEKQEGTRRTFSGSHGQIERQLYRGFMDAGRPDLARMVGTREFNAWVGEESGWNPGSTSQYFPGHGRNDGLFQVWRGHSYNSNGQVADMSPYQQALLIVEHFDLTPDDIRRYYAQIQQGTYSGWG